MTVLFLGGLDTTAAPSDRSPTTWPRPEAGAAAARPEVDPPDMDEFIRLESPVGCLGRTATRDVELAGTRSRRASSCWSGTTRPTGSGQVPDADELVFDTPRSGHAAFGLGIHRCLGATWPGSRSPSRSTSCSNGSPAALRVRRRGDVPWARASLTGRSASTSRSTGLNGRRPVPPPGVPRTLSGRHTPAAAGVWRTNRVCGGMAAAQ